MDDKQYTLDELVKRTGFSKRQIRYYITEKLVPGAGDQLGPYAVYGEETLQRLEMIKVFKAQPMGPTGRTMTLAEIRHSLDNLPGPDTSGMVCQGNDFNLLGSWNESTNEPVSSASSYLEGIEDEDHSLKEVSFSLRRPMVSGHEAPNIPAFFQPEDENPIVDLLQGLHSLLTELGSDTRIDSKVSKGDSWRRITSPDVEIQVRTPDNLEAQKRLLQMALEMGRLLAREE